MDLTDIVLIIIGLFLCNVIFTGLNILARAKNDPISSSTLVQLRIPNNRINTERIRIGYLNLWIAELLFLLFIITSYVILLRIDAIKIYVNITLIIVSIIDIIIYLRIKMDLDTFIRYLRSINRI